MCDTWLQQAKIISLTLAKGLIKAFLKKKIMCQILLPIMSNNAHFA